MKKLRYAQGYEHQSVISFEALKLLFPLATVHCLLNNAFASGFVVLDIGLFIDWRFVVEELARTSSSPGFDAASKHYGAPSSHDVHS